MIIIVVIVVAVWLTCGLVVRGFLFAYFQGHWPDLAQESYWSDFIVCSFLGLLGPLSLPGMLSEGWRVFGYGWRLR